MSKRPDPFGGAGEWWEDALLSWGNDNRIGLVIGYKMAADHLVDRAIHDGGQDFLVYPILFLYRHHLELSIKSVIETAKKYLRQSELVVADFKAPPIAHEEKARKYGHDLRRAWKDLEPLFELLDVQPNDEDINHARATLDKFHELDPKGDGFRYGDAPSEAGIHLVERINLRNLSEVVAAASMSLDGLNEWLAHLIELGYEYLAEVEGCY